MVNDGYCVVVLEPVYAMQVVCDVVADEMIRGYVYATEVAHEDEDVVMGVIAS